MSLEIVDIPMRARRKKVISPMTRPPINTNDDLKPSETAFETDAITPGPGVADRIIIPRRNATKISIFIYILSHIHQFLPKRTDSLR